MNIKVQIHDKMSKINDMYAVDQISGYIVYNGEILTNLGDYTFAKKFVPDGAKFGMVCAGSGGGGPVCLWKRFPRIEYNYYIYTDHNIWQGIAYIPNKISHLSDLAHKEITTRKT